MRIALSFVLLLIACGAYAQAPQVTGINITQYGIFTRDVIKKEAEPGSPAGTKNVVTNIRLAVQTQTIPAQKGVSFGFRYVVVGAPAGKTIPLHGVTIYPSAMTNPKTGQSSSRSESDITAAIGTASYKGYSLEDDWEVIPGTWTFQLWYQGRKLAEQTFNVQKPQ